MMKTQSELDLICKALKIDKSDVTQQALAIGAPILRQQLLTVLKRPQVLQQLPGPVLPQAIKKAKALRHSLAEYRELLTLSSISDQECLDHAAVLASGLTSTDTPAPPPSRHATKAKVHAEKPVSRPAPNSVSVGRREVLQGKRPILLKAIIKVMGDKALSAPEILERLRKKGWAPVAAKSDSYISATLAENPENFGRVKRGVYRVVSTKTGADTGIFALKTTLLNTHHFPNNAAVIQVAPATIRPKLKCKDSRERVVNSLLEMVSNLPSPVGNTFQRTVREAAGLTQSTDVATRR